jgi:hypothetical protein
VHGISIPLGKLGFYLPRTISAAVSTDRLSRRSTEDPARSDDEISSQESTLAGRFRRYRDDTSGSSSSLPRSFYRLGKSIISDVHRGHQTITTTTTTTPRASTNEVASRTISGPSNPRPLGRPVVRASNRDSPLSGTPRAGRSDTVSPTGSPPPLNRTIRFPDDG